MAVFEGAGVVLVTPLKEDGEVNYEKPEEIMGEQVVGGTDAIITCGTTGEASTVSHEEHLDVIGYVRKVSNKRVPVIAETGPNCAETAVYFSNETECRGVDGFLVVFPYYNKTTRKRLMAHFTAVTDAIKIPIPLYNMPGRTGVDIPPRVIATLCKEVDSIAKVKKTSGNFSAIAILMNLSDGKAGLYLGNDDQIAPLLPLGGEGAISVLSSVAPRQIHDIYAAYLSGDVKRSAGLQLVVIPLIIELFCEVDPIPVKMAVNIMGKNAGPTRMSLTEMEPRNQVKLRAVMITHGIP